jgi:hypothetical protein
MTDLPELTPNQGWPLSENIPIQTEDSPVCVAHVRWFPCLTVEHRYDSPNRDCLVVRDHRCAEVLRGHHNGDLTRDQTIDLLDRRIQDALGIEVEKVEITGVIS